MLGLCSVFIQKILWSEVSWVLPEGSEQVQNRLVVSCWSSLHLTFTMHVQMNVLLKLIYVFKVLNWFCSLQVDGTGFVVYKLMELAHDRLQW
jgi:hypothetical protein